MVELPGPIVLTMVVREILISEIQIQSSGSEERREHWQDVDQQPTVDIYIL